MWLIRRSLKACFKIWYCVCFYLKPILMLPLLNLKRFFIFSRSFILCYYMYQMCKEWHEYRYWQQLLVYCGSLLPFCIYYFYLLCWNVLWVFAGWVWYKYVAFLANRRITSTSLHSKWHRVFPLTAQTYSNYTFCTEPYTNESRTR